MSLFDPIRALARPNSRALLLPLSLLLACDAPPTGDGQDRVTAYREAWGNYDDPKLLDRSFNYVFAELPTSGEAELVPWPGHYWPTFRDSINERWAGPNTASPAEKYGLAFGRDGVEDAVSQAFGVDSLPGPACKKNSDCKVKGSICARRRGESEGKCAETWFGICHAWAPAAILEREPARPVTYNGVEFAVNDIKALVSLAYTAGLEVRFVSLRCDENDDHQDLDGVDACEDTNAGTFHVVVANLLGLRGQSFVEDRTYDYEVWNQPVRSFKVTRNQELSPAEANALLGGFGEPIASERRSGQVAAGAWRSLGSVPVAAGQRLRVRVDGTGDADLYVQWDSPPSESEFACRPYLSGTDETCELVVPPGATSAHVALLGHAAAKFEADIEVFDEPLGAYAFNPKAESLRRIRTELRWISEAPSHADGPLSDDVDQFTFKDVYEYVLELDGAGKIIGGEWLGASRTNHPDFLWVPIKKYDVPAAGGAVRWRDVKKLLALATE